MLTRLRWFVVETQPRAERLAVSHLERQGFPALCPHFRKTRRHARRVQSVLAPVFPGYAFVQFDPARHQWRAINGTTGVRRLVAASPMRPQPMPEGVMQLILARCEGDVMTSLVPQVAPGDEVRLVSGPFAGRLATVEGLDDRGRVRLLLDVLGGVTPVDVAREAVGPA